MTLSPEHQALVDFVKKSGLNPEDILARGWDRNGYQAFVRDADGKKIINQPPQPIGYKTVHRAWPEGYDYDEHLRLACKVASIIPPEDERP